MRANEFEVLPFVRIIMEDTDHAINSETADGIAEFIYDDQILNTKLYFQIGSCMDHVTLKAMYDEPRLYQAIAQGIGEHMRKQFDLDVRTHSIKLLASGVYSGERVCFKNET